MRHIIEESDCLGKTCQRSEKICILIADPVSNNAIFSTFPGVCAALDFYS
jgi:hypothetical protein